jgi:hypothetical protein
MNQLVIGVLFAVVTVAGVSYESYEYGRQATENVWLEKQQQAQNEIDRLNKENARLDQKAIENLNKRREIRHVVIAKSKEQASALPDRHCGWTEHERVLLVSSYCQAFPSSANCVPASVPDAGPTARPVD